MISKIQVIVSIPITMLLYIGTCINAIPKKTRLF